jgi:hypothetical protein
MHSEKLFARLSKPLTQHKDIFTVALHEQCVGATDEWYTPRFVFDAMAAQFDLDVASPGSHRVPWIPAARI